MHHQSGLKVDDADVGDGFGGHHHRRNQQSSHVCETIVERQQCALFLDVCPTECGTANASTTNPGIIDYSANCAVLLELQGGCAHDMSVHDQSVPLSTRVSDVCPTECSGHGGCEVAAADVGFLGTAEDSSGRACAVQIDGDACVDGGGMLLSGHGKSMIDVGDAYASNGAFTISFWLLKSTTDVWLPSQNEDFESQYRSSREVIYSHPAADFVTHTCKSRPSSLAVNGKITGLLVCHLLQ